jgi:Na+/melibiose symporter-like transporter
MTLLRRAPRPPLGADTPGPTQRFTWADWVRPLHNPEFRRLLGIFLLNGIANAVPATLVMFYVQDVLHRAEALPVFLGAYFLTGAISVPLWLRAVKRFGPSRAWVLGMAGYVLCFGPVITLQAGDATAYTLICLASGLMLGADLTLPSTLLAGVVQRQAQRAPEGAGAIPQEGIYTGWWQLATKLNLALAAGLALPALQAWGYTPGATDPEALWHLTLVYGALPCVLKLLAGCAWWRWWARAGLE